MTDVNVERIGSNETCKFRKRTVIVLIRLAKGEFGNRFVYPSNDTTVPWEVPDWLSCAKIEFGSEREVSSHLTQEAEETYLVSIRHFNGMSQASNCSMPSNRTSRNEKGIFIHFHSPELVSSRRVQIVYGYCWVHNWIGLPTT